MRIALPVFSCLCLLLLSHGVNAQTQSLQQLDSLAGRYIRALRSTAGEKTFLQTDRPVYRSGDMVFFKCFVMNALSGKPSRKSNILFVELVNEQDKPIRQALLNASQFKTDGSFLLPDTLASGHYWLRAYTKKSLHLPETSMYVQAIYVINASTPDSHDFSAGTVKSSPKIPADDSIRVQFFPEGGTLVGGTETMVAIKATDANNDPAAVSGFVSDNGDSVVARFFTNTAGLAKFRFFCWTWHTYQLHITRSRQPDLVYRFPPVNLFGAQVGIVEKNGIRKLRVVLEDSIFRKDKITYILGVSGDSLCFSGVGRGSYDQVLPEYRFPKGIARFLLFDEKQRLLSERRTYINGNDPLIQLTADKPNYSAREKAVLALQLTDAGYQPQVASFMVEVNDVSREAFYEPLKSVQTQLPDQEGIWDAMTGIVTKLSAEDRELWLLTRETPGTNDILRQMHEKQWDDTALTENDSSLYIQGRVVDDRNRAAQHKIVTLFGDLKTKLFTTDTTDASGRFCFPFTAYDDKTKFNLQVTELSGKLFPGKIRLDTLLRIPQVKTPAVLKQRFVSETIATVRKKMVVQSGKDSLLQKRGKEWLADVTVTGLIKKDPGYDVKKRQSLFSKIIPPEALAKLPGNSLGNVIFRVPGIHLRNGFVTVNGGNSFVIGADAEPLLIVDGIPIPTDTADKLPGSEPSPLMLALNRIDPALVEFIEVLTGSETAVYGTRGGNGVIIVNTRSKLVIDDDGKPNGIRNLSVKGFHVPESFEQRDYAVKEIRNTKIPDTRTLIYWNGDGLTDNNGKALVSFYTADPVTSYLVTVTGITANGMYFQKQITISRK